MTSCLHGEAYEALAFAQEDCLAAVLHKQAFLQAGMAGHQAVNSAHGKLPTCFGKAVLQVAGMFEARLCIYLR
jgi:hypothetical protein